MSGIAALKGYRTQFLYSLNKILKEKNLSNKYRLEGIEDIDILSENGILLEVIQVKNLNTTLTLSDLVSKKNTSFLRRFLDIKGSTSNTKATLISFGNVSNDLTKWLLQKDSISQSEKKALSKYGLKENEWKTIKNNLLIVTANEIELYNEILSLLKEQYKFVDPVPTLKVLLFWLSYNAEKQITLTLGQLFKEVQNIGNYLSERIAVTQQLGIYISPIEPSNRGIDGGKLKEEFYAGISARYDHVVHGLDIIRENAINAIVDGFSYNNAVIIQGASGQGKSTIAYRYIKDNCPETLCYELNLQEDDVNTRTAINSINALAKELNVPALFLVNVDSNSTQWIKIIREFANENYIRFLVTIRQEDWYKATSFGIEFLHTEIEVKLTKEEAQEIYYNLDEQKVDLKNIDFDEAWIKFGGDGPLLEFIYSITQGDSLSNKLRQQVFKIELEQNSHELLDILRIVSMADTYGAKVSVEKIRHISNVITVTRRLEKEYLIKVDNGGKHLSGLHHLRSKLLITHLFDEIIICKSDYILKCLEYISPNDAFSFFREVLDKGIITVEELIQNSFRLPQSWFIYFQLMQSLIWKGVCEYVEENKSVLDIAYANWGDAWYMFVDIYFGNTLDPQKFLKELHHIPDSAIDEAKILSSTLTDKSSVFNYVQHLFKILPLPSPVLETDSDWRCFGGVVFWLKHIPNELEITDKLTIDESTERNVDIQTLSEVLFGLSFFDKCFESSIKMLQTIFIRKLQKEFNIPYLNISDHDANAIYIADILSNDKSFSLHSSSVEIITLLRKAFPDKEKYSIQAFGQNISLLPLDYDESIKNISKENLPLDYWVNLNALLKRRFEFVYAPEDWQTYFLALKEWEDKMYGMVSGLTQVFTKPIGSHSKTDIELIASNLEYNNIRRLLKPQSIQDSSGLYGGEIDDVNIDEKKKETILKFQTKFDKFFKAKSKFEHSIENFIRQSATYVYDLMKIIAQPEYEVQKNNLHISQINLFEATKSIVEYKKYRDFQFNKFSESSLGLTQAMLCTTSHLYRNFINNRAEKTKPKMENRFLTQIRSDFELRINAECKKHSQKGNFELKYYNGILTNNIPVIKILTNEPINILFAVKAAFTSIKSAIGEIEHTSLKQLLINLSFDHFYFLPIVKGFTINHTWYELPNYKFRESFEDLSVFSWITKPIDAQIKISLQLLDWNDITSKTVEAQTFLLQYLRMQSLVQHISDLQKFESYDLNEDGYNVLKQYVVAPQEEIGQLCQQCLDYLSDIGTEYFFETVLDENDEMEVELWKCYIEIGKYIFPKNKGDEVDYKIMLELGDFTIWSERLANCTQNVTIFYYLFLGKLIRAHESHN